MSPLRAASSLSPTKLKIYCALVARAWPLRRFGVFRKAEGRASKCLSILQAGQPTFSGGDANSSALSRSGDILERLLAVASTWECVRQSRTGAALLYSDQSLYSRARALTLLLANIARRNGTRPS